MRVLIAGCGYVGRALAARLAAAGDDAYGLSRGAAPLAGGATVLRADLGDAAALTRALPDGLDAVVYSAAPDAHDEAAYRATYVDGLANLRHALATGGGSPRLLFVSSTGVYHQDDGAWVDEDSPALAEHFGGHVLREAEALAWEHPHGAVVLRLAGIYGPGRTGLVDAVRSGRAPGAAGTISNRIHRDDAAAAIEHLLRLPAPAPLYLGVDDEPALLDDVVRWIATRLGVPVPRAFDGAGGMRERSRKRCSNRRLVASGFRCAYPSYREGFGALITAG